MVENPAGTLTQVCKLAEIRYDEAMLKFRSVVHHNVNGNHLKFGTEEKIRLDEAWKSGLSQSDAMYFESKAGTLNRFFGYQIRRVLVSVPPSFEQDMLVDRVGVNVVGRALGGSLFQCNSFARPQRMRT